MAKAARIAVASCRGPLRPRSDRLELRAHASALPPPLISPATRASHDAALVALTVQRPPGPGDVPSEVDFDVLAEGEVVGRLMVAELSSGLGTVWLWTIDLSHRDRRFPNHGYEATREAAMQAFAKSWHREA